jgi:hypothetical protein
MRFAELLTKRFLLGMAAICLVLPAAVAQADRAVNDNEPIVISDDITNQTTRVISETQVSRSGLGDDTNPGAGDGTDNATNDGTNNPTGGDPGSGG